MQKWPILMNLLMMSTGLIAQDGHLPIIDMHMHGYSEQEFWQGPVQGGLVAAKSKAVLEQRLREIMDQYHIVLGLLSASPETIRDWKQKDKRFIGGYEYIHRDMVDTLEFKKLIEAGVVQAFAEVGTVYRGDFLTDKKFEPYLQICERYNIPVGYHTGNTAPGLAYNSPFRVKNSDPFLIEDILAKHPALKVFIMHSGAEFYEHCIALMRQYPHVYSELGILLWGDDLTKQQAIEFLKQAKTAKILNRVMFGSDQMVWPDAVIKSIEFLNSLDFLTIGEKRDIFYNNAARFLGLSKHNMETHFKK